MKEVSDVATLIVAFARPDNLQLQISQLIKQKEQIFVFIDRAGENSDHLKLNQATVKTALENQQTYPSYIAVKFSEVSHGVRNGVPAALEWFTAEAAHKFKLLVVREDDILIENMDEYFAYLKLCKEELNEKIQIASLLSPFDFTEEKMERKQCTLSKYPLTWGWITRTEYLVSLFRPRSNQITIRIFLHAIKSFLDSPIGISYFLSAHIRRNRPNNSAWDGDFCFRFLQNRLFCIIPNKSLITNVGNDQVRNHDFAMGNQDMNLLNTPSSMPLQPELDSSAKSRYETEKIIERNVYQFKSRHLLSPIKAMFR
jgi:hypothetical protein